MVTEKLNQRQEEAVNCQPGPLLIIAGAGSGKTRTLTSRIIKLLEGGTPPGKILAITFTNKAAGEMAKRIAGNRLPIDGLFIGTFHSFGAKVLRREARFFKRTSHFTIFDDEDSTALIKKVLKNADSNNQQPGASLISWRISKIKSNLKNERTEDEPFQKIYKDYEETLVKNNAFDFDDLIEKPVRLWQAQPGSLAKYQRQYQHILVDEFQDTNSAQYLLVKLLAEKHRSISVVGDDAQSIYGWRHADFRNFLDFDKDWPEAKIVKLEENYRSTVTIIKAANQVIKNNKLQKKKELWTKNPIGEPVKVVAAGDEEAAAEWLADKVLNITRTSPLEETAVLYRTNAQSRPIEQALTYQQIPYRIFGGVKFYERKEIKDVLAGLRLAFNAKDQVSQERLRKNFPRNKSDHLIENLPRLARELTIVQLINFIINQTDYFRYLENNFKNYQERTENIEELINFAANFVQAGQNRGGELGDFLERVGLAQSHDNPTLKAKGINLMTIHLAKGLEFDHVFLSGCNEGILPHQRSYSSNQELEEERRLMYVAMTRARKKLFLLFSSLPSRFLYEIPPELVEFESLDQTQRSLPDEEKSWIEYD